MIKICANVSKKVPVPGIQFSSQHFGASMEVEVSDVDSPEMIQKRIRSLYALLSDAVDEQIVASGDQSALNGEIEVDPSEGQPEIVPEPQVDETNPRPAVQGASKPVRRRCATIAQQRAISAICRNLGVSVGDVLIGYDYNQLDQVPIGTASQIINDLQSRLTDKNTPARL